MIDVGLSVFRAKGAMGKYVHRNNHGSPSTGVIVSPFSRETTEELGSYFERGAEERGRRTAEYLSLASVATGHSLVAPCGLGNTEEAGGAGQGGGEETPSPPHTGCNSAGRRKMASLWEGFYYWDV